MTATPKVLHIHFGKEGGAERFFVNLATAFDHVVVGQDDAFGVDDDSRSDPGSRCRRPASKLFRIKIAMRGHW